MSSRRKFVKTSGLALLGIGVGGIPTFLARAAETDNLTMLYKKKKILICVFQRGAMDGLMAVTPFEDQYLKAARPSLFMTAAKAAGNAQLIDLDGCFGLHPAMSAFEPLFREKRLAIVHGIGSDHDSRAHFNAQRHLEAAAAAMAGKENFEAINTSLPAGTANYKPANNAEYPDSTLGGSLKQIAQLIKRGEDIEVAFAESDGWDTHFDQGTATGLFARNAADLSNSVAAFWKDIEIYQDDVMVMTMTEFGRTVKQNGTGDTDHGRASCSFILGNAVNGGLVHGNVQPLSAENLDQGRDLAVTTDFRSVFSEVADKHLKISNDDVLFPDWKGKKIEVMK
jgi:uncharacterized protein (DUF1501 family)